MFLIFKLITESLDMIIRENKIYTKNLVPGSNVYGERLIKIDGIEYREWDPYRSKLAAAILKGLKNFKFKNNSSVLYLGASTGTTISHISDICYEAEIYAVEISKRSMLQLVELAKVRKNIIPILADANHPMDYQDIGKIDILYQDIAQPNQIEIFDKNVNMFKPTYAYLCLKTQSIDVSVSPSKILERELLKIPYRPIEIIDLNPYDKHHYFLVFHFYQ